MATESFIHEVQVLVAVMYREYINPLVCASVVVDELLFHWIIHLLPYVDVSRSMMTLFTSICLIHDASFVEVGVSLIHAAGFEVGVCLIHDASFDVGISLIHDCQVLRPCLIDDANF